MLNNLTVNNYKCLVECSLELKPLNLFAGPNSSGKSTALQALLIASDNVTEQRQTRSEEPENRSVEFQ